MRKMILVLLLVLFPAVGWADEYVLVMSKEDNVCQQMHKLYNEDLRKYGEVKYEEHEEFTAIKWEGKKYYMMRDGKKEHPAYSYLNNTVLMKEGKEEHPADSHFTNTVLMSKFDINNDGKEEVVIKDKGMLHSDFTESLYYFKSEDSAYFKDEEFDIKILYTKATEAVGTGGFKGNTYDLKELPKRSSGIIGDKEFYSHYSLGGYFFVNPFVFKRAYYISMRAETPSSRGIFLIILQYTPDNELKDICYYIKVSE